MTNTHKIWFLFYFPRKFGIQAAYEGTFPEHDAWGQPLTGDRARMAGKPLCGGPWALTQFRTALQKKSREWCVNEHCSPNIKISTYTLSLA